MNGINGYCDERYRALIKTGFIVKTLLASCLLSYWAGRAARPLLFQSQHPELESPKGSSFSFEGRKYPAYLPQTFKTPRKASSSSWLLNARDTMTLIAEDNTDIEDNKSDGCGVECQVEDDEDDDDDDDEEEAEAEHLMVDIKNVDDSFLNSERRLANALLELVSEAKLTILSYHCIGLVPKGVSCVGLLKKNYVSLHTWPERGVISLDLCVGGTSASLFPLMPIIERIFGVPQASHLSSDLSGKKIEVKWARKFRGFDHDERINDLSLFVVNDLGPDRKTEVVTVQTDYQTINIFDFEFKSTKTSINLNSLLHHTGFHDPKEPLVHRPDRIILLDGWLQSTLHDEAAYHEALVHPAMFAHEAPKRVAIIGGGEGATLREVLKHNTVEEAIMIEIDEKMVNVSRQYIPEWSDCSDLEGSANWCVDDPRSTMYYEDALAWFMNRYSNGNSTAEPIDVIIVDALDPESEIPFSKALYSDKTLMEAFNNAMPSDGIIIMQLGETPQLFAADETRSKFKNRVVTEKLLEEVGFESVHAYEESHCGFGGSWEFMVGFKSWSSRKRWYANPAEVELAMQKRGVRTKSGQSPFHYFNGATMASYQVPSRSVENVFCRRQPVPPSCKTYMYNPERPNVPTSLLEVKASSLGENAGRGLFTKVDIPKGSYIGGEVAGATIRFFPSTREVIDGLYTSCNATERELEVLEYYMDGYGFTSRKFGKAEVFVDASILTFVNHGCNGTYNTGRVTKVNELTADLETPIDELNGRIHSDSLFDPVIDRHLFSSITDASIRDIKAGEEILDNYLNFIGSDGDWANDVSDLRKQCNGEKTKDSVNEYEDCYASGD
jgi:spermidine synthase/S-adenosylmethionine/arginine decarboxylase-like enzyme